MFDFVKKVLGKDKKEKTVKESKRSSIPEAVKFEVLPSRITGVRCAGNFLESTSLTT